MLEIIAHRGLWDKPEQRNTKFAFEAAFREGFGIETDIRDLDGDLVISHDMPTMYSDHLSLDELLELYSSQANSFSLALNIKSDGLCASLKHKLRSRAHNYFVFDMSVPDTLPYKSANLRFFTRQSEYEIDPALYDDACGVWLDEFFSSWITEDVVRQHFRSGKRVAIVSPELHGRSYDDEWKKYKSIAHNNPELEILLCTDFPLEARRYFEQ